MDRAEAEALFDSGRERCVEFLLGLDERVRRLEEQSRTSSRNSSKAPSQDLPKTRQQRRAEARAKAKELLEGNGERRQAGGQPGHRGSGRKLLGEDQMTDFSGLLRPPTGLERK